MTGVVDALTLLDLVHAAIVAAATDAQDRVFKPGDWPTQSDQYPIIKLRLGRVFRQGHGRSGPADFTAQATIRLSLEASAPAQLDDAGATNAETALWQLARQVDVAVVNDYDLMLAIQQIVSMDSQLAFSSEAATHLAGINTDLVLEFYEPPENFAPTATEDLDELHAQLTDRPPLGFTASNLNT